MDKRKTTNRERENTFFITVLLLKKKFSKIEPLREKYSKSRLPVKG
jgi:hypothetical protein